MNCIPRVCRVAPDEIMNATSYPPDARYVGSELSFESAWDSAALSDLIRSKSSFNETPACLFLGRREAELLRGHLAQAFGDASVSTLRGTYYMGLEVVELDCDAFVRVGGRKTSRILQDPIARRPAWRDEDTAGLWSLRLS